MAGFRFKLEEKALLVNIVKAAITAYENTIKEQSKKGRELAMYGAMRQHKVASDILAKIEGTFTATEA